MLELEAENIRIREFVVEHPDKSMISMTDLLTNYNNEYNVAYSIAKIRSAINWCFYNYNSNEYKKYCNDIHIFEYLLANYNNILYVTNQQQLREFKRVYKTLPFRPHQLQTRMFNERFAPLIIQLRGHDNEYIERRLHLLIDFTNVMISDLCKEIVNKEPDTLNECIDYYGIKLRDDREAKRIRAEEEARLSEPEILRDVEY